MKIQIPKDVAPGRVVYGPDFPGCINSGFEPMITNQPFAEKYLGKRYIVGYSGAVQLYSQELRMWIKFGVKSPELDRFKIRFFDNFKDAAEYFKELHKPIVEEIRRREKLKKRIKKNPFDFDALMQLQ